MPSPKPLKDRVLLTAFSKSDEIVETHKLDIHKYWDGSHPVIDERAYRKKRKIRKLLGRMYDGKGGEYNRWMVFYNADGSNLASVAIQTDGFVRVDGEIPT